MKQNFYNSANNLEAVLVALIMNSKPSISYMDAINICLTSSNKPRLLRHMCKYISKMANNALSDILLGLSAQHSYSAVFESFSSGNLPDNLRDNSLGGWSGDYSLNTPLSASSPSNPADGFLNNTPAYLSSEYAKACSILNDIVETDRKYSKFIETTTNILLPIDSRVRFMDKQIGMVERSYRRVMHRVSRRYKEKFVDAIGIILLYVKIRVNADASYSIARNILRFLKIYGLKEYCLGKIRKILAEQDYFILRGTVDDYRFVNEYFKRKREYFNDGIYSGVERKALYRLYGEYDCAKIVEVLKGVKMGGSSRNNDSNGCDSGENINICDSGDDGNANSNKEENNDGSDNTILSFIYNIYSKSGLTDMLLDAYKSFIVIKISDRFVYDLYENYLKNFVILEYFKDPIFLKASEAYYSTICDDFLTAKYISDWVDISVRMDGVGNENVFRFISFIIQKSNNPENILEMLRVSLGNRLICKRAEIKNECLFLDFLKKMHSGNMFSMIEDIANCKWMDKLPRVSGMNSSHTGVDAINVDGGSGNVSYAREDPSNACLLIKMCKWPEYKTADVEPFELMDPIKIYKEDVEKKLKKNGKRIVWMDVLSRATIDIFGKRIVVTLFQLSILLKLSKARGRINIEDACSDEGTVSGAEQMNIPPIYQAQFKLLLAGGVILHKNGVYKLSKNFKEVSFVPERYEQSSALGDIDDSLDINSSKAVLESRVMGIMKQKKKMNKDELLKLVPMGSGVLEDLVEKGYIEVTENVVVYIS